jgi:hypothetical protein
MSYLGNPPDLVLNQLNGTVAALIDNTPGGREHIEDLFTDNSQSACRFSPLALSI